MKIIEENGLDIWIELPCGTKTVISKEDKWITEVFPVWYSTNGNRVGCERSVKTEYSTLREKMVLSRLIVNLRSSKIEVDHIDRNPLNNRRSNLRKANRSQNAANMGPKKGTKYKGVVDQSSYRKLKKPFAVFCYVEDTKTGKKKTKNIGYYPTAEEAARAYDKRAKEIYGEFAYLNFPEEK